MRFPDRPGAGATRRMGRGLLPQSDEIITMHKLLQL